MTNDPREELVQEEQVVNLLKESELRVHLVEERGETSIFIDASIDDNGTLLISGQDVGKAPKEFWGDSDYEYWISISSKEKDKVLLILLESLYKGDFRVISKFRKLLDEKEIEYEFNSWV